MAVRNYKSQSRVIIHDWNLKTFSPDESDTALSKSTRLDVSRHITNVSFSKNLASPSGTFEIHLDNTKKWTNVIKKDTWCVIYMSNSENIRGSVDDKLIPSSIPEKKFVRAICYIERVAINEAEIDGEGSKEVGYVLTGRDFGKVYEDTEIYLNVFQFDAMFVNSLSGNLKSKNIATTDKLIELGHKLFFSPDFDLQPPKEFTELSKQWIMPSSLLNDLQLQSRASGGATYYGTISNLFDFSETNTTIPISDPLKSITGNAWQKLKSWSIDKLNELYCETEGGEPRLTYRAIPWGINQKGYPSLAQNIKLFKTKVEEDGIILEDVDITSKDMGEDSHNRYNHFYAWSSANMMKATDNVGALKNQISKQSREFPYVNKASVKRNGFKPLHAELNTLTYSIKESKDGKPDTNRLLEYNEVLYDYWAPAAYFESGAITIIGRNDIKIGKALRIDSGSLKGKAFYIEGYTDEYIVEEGGEATWTQTLQLTRGVEYAKLKDSFTEAELDATEEGTDRGTFVED